MAGAAYRGGTNVGHHLQAQVWESAQEEQKAWQEKREEEAPALKHAAALLWQPRSGQQQYDGHKRCQAALPST